MRCHAKSNPDKSVTIIIPAREAAALAALERKMDEVSGTDLTGLDFSDTDLVHSFIKTAADAYFDQLREIIKSKGGNPDDYPVIAAG